MAVYLEVLEGQDGLLYQITDELINITNCSISRNEENVSFYSNGSEFLIITANQDAAKQLMTSVKAVLKDNNLSTFSHSFNVFFNIKSDSTGLHLARVIK